MTRILIKTILRIAAKYRLPWLAACALRWITTSVSGVQSHNNASSRQPIRALVLSFNKAGTREDIEQVFLNSLEFELVIWPSYSLRAIARTILAPGLVHNRYLTSLPAVEESKRQYREYLRLVWARYMKLLPVDVVISVNFGYYVQREFAAALEESGTPFIVLHKENFNGITPKRANFWRKVYKEGRGKFNGRKILVYNDIERDLQISGGIAPPNKVIVTGMPRLDRIHRWRKQQAGRPIGTGRPFVLFFGFGRREKIPILFKKEMARLHSAIDTPTALETAESDWVDTSLDELCRGTCKAIAEFARRRPDVQVLVKTKVRAAQTEDTLTFLGSDGSLPSNIEIITGGDPFDLLTRSNVVVGFNTTGLIEAVAAGKPVIVPKFAEARSQSVVDIALDLGEAVEYANSPQHLVELISAQVDQQLTTPIELSASCTAMLRRFVGNDDGAAGSRVLDAIRSEIRRTPSEQPVIPA